VTQEKSPRLVILFPRRGDLFSREENLFSWEEKLFFWEEKTAVSLQSEIVNLKNDSANETRILLTLIVCFWVSWGLARLVLQNQKVYYRNQSFWILGSRIPHNDCC
jgi:hypothetical protein